jgi:hypothetical protein
MMLSGVGSATDAASTRVEVADQAPDDEENSITREDEAAAETGRLESAGAQAAATRATEAIQIRFVTLWGISDSWS